MENLFSVLKGQENIRLSRRARRNKSALQPNQAMVVRKVGSNFEFYGKVKDDVFSPYGANELMCMIIGASKYGTAVLVIYG